jgi:hypothetical protein
LLFIKERFSLSLTFEITEYSLKRQGRIAP